MANGPGDEGGRITDFARARVQIQQGSRLLVREVKELVLQVDELEAADLARRAEAAVKAIEGGDFQGGEAQLDRTLAPLISGPGSTISRGSDSLLVSLTILFLILVALLLLWP